jgi:hypothetical protein
VLICYAQFDDGTKRQEQIRALAEKWLEHLPEQA